MNLEDINRRLSDLRSEQLRTTEFRQKLIIKADIQYFNALKYRLEQQEAKRNS